MVDKSYRNGVRNDRKDLTKDYINHIDNLWFTHLIWKRLKVFFKNFNFMVIIQMVVAGLAVYIFKISNISFSIPICLFVSPIVFPLAFSIHADFQRREKVLEDLANFKSSSMMWFFCMRDWKERSGLDDAWLDAVHMKLRSLLFHLREYLFTSRPDRRKIILIAMYEDLSDTNQLIEKVRVSKLPANSPVISRVIHFLHMMCLSFERLRVIREYRSPRSIRSFNKVLIFILPLILAPYFVYLGKNSGNDWSGYYMAVLVSFVFSFSSRCARSTRRSIRWFGVKMT